MSDDEANSERRAGSSRRTGGGGSDRNVLARHPWASGGVAAAVALVAFVLVYFEPQALFFDRAVNEPAPAVATAPVGTPPPQEPGASPSTVSTSDPVGVIASGAFQSLEHESSGRAQVGRLADGSLYVRLVELNTSNGPDLHVILSPAAVGADLGAYGGGAFEVGKLKGNIGSQNYPLPDGIDLSRFKSVVIWCERFSVGFAVAPLA